MTCWKVGRFVQRIVNGKLPPEWMRSTLALACHSLGSCPVRAANSSPASFRAVGIGSFYPRRSPCNGKPGGDRDDPPHIRPVGLCPPASPSVGERDESLTRLSRTETWLRAQGPAKTAECPPRCVTNITRPNRVRARVLLPHAGGAGAHSGTALPGSGAQPAVRPTQVAARTARRASAPDSAFPTLPGCAWRRARMATTRSLSRSAR